MTGDRTTLQAQYVALSPYRPDAIGQPSVVALPVPEPYGQRRVAGYAIEKSQPAAVGAFLHWLLTESHWTITERTVRDELPIAVPIEPRHVCLLFRRFLQFGQDVTRPYVEALEARGVPHLLVGGKSFHDREEVETIRAALAAIEWPDDELSVFATLRGALFASRSVARVPARTRGRRIRSARAIAWSRISSRSPTRCGPAPPPHRAQLPAGRRYESRSCRTRRGRTSVGCGRRASGRWPTCCIAGSRANTR
jgi:hypothetical protein